MLSGDRKLYDEPVNFEKKRRRLHFRRAIVRSSYISGVTNLGVPITDWRMSDSSEWPDPDLDAARRSRYENVVALRRRKTRI